MSNSNDFTNNGFSVLDSQNNTKNSPFGEYPQFASQIDPLKGVSLVDFLKTNYPSIIKDNEINLTELKAIAGLPVDEKTNGYGLNFVGRNVARSKYAKKTEKELKLNQKLSKNIDTTKNLILKGDNLDSLKILKNHYQNKIKCIYIDPPYNTTSDEFVYPDKFNKEEAEVLGIATDTADFERMEFSFKTKKSHNGWLSFMYPRLMLARDLLKDDGVIFISIDDNEQANLKLLCDEIFGEENTEMMIWRKSGIGRDGKMKNTTTFRNDHEYVIVAHKLNKNLNKSFEKPQWENEYGNPDNDPRGNYKAGSISRKEEASNPNSENYYTVISPSGKTFTRQFEIAKELFDKLVTDKRIYWGKNGDAVPSQKIFAEEKREVSTSSLIDYKTMTTTLGSKEIEAILQTEKLGEDIRPKPSELLIKILKIGADKDSIILDFFAGSGTTGHAVMQLNSEDGGDRKFILCQIDEPIKKDKPAYKFCKDNDLEPVISSITIERLKRAGEKLKVESEKLKVKNEGNLGQLEFEDTPKIKDFDPLKGVDLDTGFKVFDSVDSPSLALVEENTENSPLEGWQPQVDGVDTTQTNTQVELIIPQIDALSRVYNMIFSIGLDEPTVVPEEILEDSIYKIGDNYYLTNCDNIDKEELNKVIKSAFANQGNVFIDGWTASINTTLQVYKEQIKIVF